MNRNRIWYYLSLVGIIFSIGVIIAGIVTGETLLIGKIVLLLFLSIYTFARERKAKQEAQARELQERLNQTTEPMRDQEEDKGEKWTN